MIRFSGTNGRGRTIIGIGISAGNVQKLKQGHPIHIHADDMGFPGEIIIFFGKTEDAMARDMRALIDADTRVHDTRQDKKN